MYLGGRTWEPRLYATNLSCSSLPICSIHRWTRPRRLRPRHSRHIAGTRVDALEVYCRNCRRPCEDVAEADYEALIDNPHLIGGDQSQRGPP